VPDWLFEGRTGVYVVLAALTAFLLLVWWQTRKRGFLIGAGAVCLLVGVYALLDYTVETDSDQIVHKVKAMIAAVNAGNIEGIFEHVSDDFRSPSGRSKADLRGLAQHYIGQKIVTSVDVWDIILEEKPSREQRTAKVSFQVKVHGQPGVEGFFATCEATFDFNPQHGWRMKGARLLKPQTTQEWEWQI
jgi:hypothetical protein